MTQQMQSGKTPRFQLTRLILVDSYTPGRISELPLIGGTAITGRNGRGKTSLLQLNSAFWGERPDRIVRSVSNKLNFARYYLPRVTSFIIFEYRRDDVYCCSVLFADESGDGVNYRFVRSPYSQELFVLDDERSIVQSNSLAERMKLKGVYISRKMALDDYRAIIQGKIGHGSDRAWQRQMIAEFAFCPTNRSVQHMERIVSGMFMRETNFNDLQRMVIASVSDAGNQLALNTERKKIESWPDAYDNYSAVMNEESRMERVQTAYAAVMAAEEELRRIRARFVLLDAHLEIEQNQLGQGIDLAQMALNEKTQMYNVAKDMAHEAIEKAQREITYREGEIGRIEGKSKEYERADVAAKAALIGREHEIAQTRKQLGERKALLIGEQTNIEQEYQSLFGKIEREHLKRMPQFGIEREAQRNDHGKAVEALGKHRDTRIAETQKNAENEQKTLQQHVDAANVSVGEAKGAAKNPQAAPELTAAWERQLAAVAEARSRVNETNEVAQHANGTYSGTKTDYAKAEKQLERLRGDAGKLEDELKALRLHATPSENSILYRLRNERPNWTEDIAKVIREDILTRTDLSPVIDAVSDGIYGLEIDLSRLDAPLAADETALRSQITTRLEELNGVRELIGKQEAVLAKADEARQLAERIAEMKSRELATAKTALTTAEVLEKAAKKAERESKDSARQRAGAAFEQAQTAHRECVEKLDAFRRRLSDTIAAIVSEYKGSAVEAQSKLDRAFLLVSNREAEEKARFAKEMETIAQERAGKLKTSGVDTVALQKLESEISSVDAQLDSIDTARSLVAEWKVWQEAERDRMPEHTKALGTARDGLKASRDGKRDLDASWEKDKADRLRNIVALGEKKKAITEERTKVAVRCKPLEGYAPDRAVLGLPYAAEWSLPNLVAQANEQQRAVTVGDASLKDDISAIKTVFGRHRGSPQDSFAETHRQEMGPDRAADAREWVPVFKQWYGTVHEQYRKILSIDARQIAGAIRFFYDGMRSFHNKVGQFNRELQDNLNANVGFESIGGVSIEIVSSIRELEYWGAIERVANCQDAWARSDEGDLPPTELAAMLRELLDHWQIREGIKAELTSLIRIQGEVVENGVRRPFKKGADLKEISSNGLSYIILVLIFIGFINRVRGDASINVVWALDELKDLDAGNVETLFNILSSNNITLICACPDPDPDTLSLFANRRSIRADRCIYDPRSVTTPLADATESEEESYV